MKIFLLIWIFSLQNVYSFLMKKVIIQTESDLSPKDLSLPISVYLKSIILTLGIIIYNLI